MLVASHLPRHVRPADVASRQLLGGRHRRQTRLRVDAALQSGGRLARTTGARMQKLAAGGARLFAPLLEEHVCTEIYGGPQRARIVGTVAGKRVWTTFTRTNGCEIEPLGSRVSVARCLRAA